MEKETEGRVLAVLGHLQDYVKELRGEVHNLREHVFRLEKENSLMRTTMEKYRLVLVAIGGVGAAQIPAVQEIFRLM